MIDYLNIVYGTLFLFVLIVIEWFMKYFTPFIMKKWIILYCPKCKSMKLKYGKEKREFICKRSGTLMEWIEIPEDLFWIQVKYFRIAFALFIPLTLIMILLSIFGPIFTGHTMGALIIFIVVWPFAYLIPRIKIKNWVAKL